METAVTFATSYLSKTKQQKKHTSAYWNDSKINEILGRVGSWQYFWPMWRFVCSG